MVKYRKKPIVIEAMQLRLDNASAVAGFCGGRFRIDGINQYHIEIVTAEGVAQMKAMPGDWVIHGVAGEFYPVKPGIFTETYEPVED